MPKKEKNILVPAKELKEMRKQIDDMQNLMYGKGGEQPQLVKDIVSAITTKMDVEQINGKLVTLIVVGFISITLLVAIILLVCLFQSQLVDVTELTEIL